MKILIVEDSMFVQNVIQKIILDNFPDCEIFTAENGEIGYKTFLEQKPDVITTDLLMPFLNGQAMLKKIRKIDSETKVIVVSADVQQVTKEEVEKLNIEEFINKPVTSDKAELMIKHIKEAHYVK